METTYKDVKNWIKNNVDETINDIQVLLELNCCNKCKKCEYSLLCVRDEDGE